MQTNMNTDTSSGSSGSSGVKSAAGDTPSQLFTTLLVAQIQNQNPLDPADPSEFVGQLTQLSQMEALQKLVSQGTANSSVMESMQVLSLGAQVGSRVSVRTESMSIGKDKVSGSFQLADASTKTALVLTDAGGHKYRLELGTKAPGEVPFTLDPVALGVPAGEYALSVETTSGEKPGVDVNGELQSVKLGNNGVQLRVSGLGDVASSLITGFHGRASGSGS